uniref:SHSP domain-containing protein n=1 Tax=Panagrolaimus sp. PS1159 TaxID=55785 RepID=A0AC35G9Q1_9BILA
MTTRYYEESEYYVKEYERKNGSNREMVDQEYRTRGIPFEGRFKTDILDLADFSIPLSRFCDDWDSRRLFRDHRRNSSYNRRQQSLPPKRSYQPPPTVTRAYSPPRYQETYRPPPEPKKWNFDSYAFPPPSATTYRPPTDYRPPADPIRSHFPLTKPISRPGSPQNVAGAGDIINTEDGFTIQLDVKHFEPHDIKVSLTGNSLSVTGERIEDDPSSAQSLKRSFSRRYAIPDDIRLESIKSHMTDTGMLIIRGNRKTWKQTDIDVHVDYGLVSDV